MTCRYIAAAIAFAAISSSVSARDDRYDYFDTVLNLISIEQNVIVTDPIKDEMRSRYYAEFERQKKAASENKSKSRDVGVWIPGPLGQIQGQSQISVVYPPISPLFEEYSKTYGKLIVKVRPPSPPQYVVTINGKEYPSDKEILSYLVVSGRIEVVVKRAGKNACSWVGQVSTSGYELNCKL